MQDDTIVNFDLVLKVLLLPALVFLINTYFSSCKGKCLTVYVRGNSTKKLGSSGSLETSGFCIMSSLPFTGVMIAFFNCLGSWIKQVRELENNLYFNAGRGSVLTSNGTVEMEACIMDGNTKNCGAVSGLTTVVNAISLARLVMEKTPHIYLAFEGAEAFAREQGVETTDSSHFITPRNIERLKQAKEANKVQVDYNTRPIPKDDKTPAPSGDSQLGTVGCVAVDSFGHLAAATSTGGLVNKMVGRIGDTPVIGAGTYANKLCAVSATGQGEAIIRATVARDVAALMEYKGLSLKEAADYVIEQSAPKGTTGLIAVSATGEVTMPFNTTGMFRACATEDGHTELAIW